MAPGKGDSMTYNEKKELLNEFAYLDARINAKIKEKEKWYSRLLSLKSNSREEGIDVDSSEILNKVVSLEKEIDKQIDDLIDFRSKIVEKIEELPNPSYRHILYSKYILGIPFEKQGELSGYCSKQISRLHKKAVEMLDLSEF